MAACPHGCRCVGERPCGHEGRPPRAARRSAMTTGTRSRLVGVVMAAAITAGVVPAIAGATDYCVTPASSCPASSVTEPTFEAALAAAGTAPDADRVFLGADTYTAPVTNGFAYDHPSSP